MSAIRWLTKSESALRGPEQDALGGRLDDRPVLLLAVTQGLLALDPLAHIADGGDAHPAPLQVERRAR